MIDCILSAKKHFWEVLLNEFFVEPENRFSLFLYLKTTQIDPFNLLYTTAGLTAIINMDDKSYSMSPEITYTGFTNWECRLRLTVLQGGDATEYGEKPNEYKTELRVRHFF